MKGLTAAIFALFVAGVLIGLAQLWFAPWLPETFLKIEVTDGAAIVLIAAWAFYTREREDFDKIDRGGKLK